MHVCMCTMYNTYKYVKWFMSIMYYRCGALSSLEGLIHYLGLHTNPDDVTYCTEHKAQLGYVGHVISVVLKNSVSSSSRQSLTNVQVDRQYTMECEMGQNQQMQMAKNCYQIQPQCNK